MTRWVLSLLCGLLASTIACRGGSDAPRGEAASYHSVAVDTTAPAEDRLAALFAGYDRNIIRSVPVDTADARHWVDSLLSALTLDEKIGQLIIVDLVESGIRGIFSDPVGLVRSHGIGGFLVPRLLAPEDVYRRTTLLQQSAKVPLFFAADYERGVGRFNNPFTELPSNMAMGATDDTVFAAAGGRITAIEARAEGVNLLFAPVVDVNNNPQNPIINIRSYGENPELVGRMASAYVAAAQQEGVLTTLKHFPGHGNTEVDTHARMAVVEGDLSDLEQMELLPYKQVLERGQRPAGVMTAHLWLPGVDENPLPATFSRRILTGILRERLQFGGFVVTDDIKMGALEGDYDVTERIVRPLEAGADIILTPRDPLRAIETVRTAVQNGRLSEARINESVRRILWAKASAGLHRQRVPDRRVLDYLLQEPRGAQLAQAIADQAVTVLRAEGGMPLIQDTRTALFQLTNSAGSESIAAAMDLFRSLLEQQGLVSGFRSEADLSPDIKEQALQASAAASVYVVALYVRLIAGRGDALLSLDHGVLISELIRTGKPVVLITFGNPYLVSTVPEAAAHVVAYDQTLETVRSVYRVLVGELEPNGRLPITVDPYPYGSGL